MDIKKSDLKDIVHQMISVSMETFDLAFDDSDMTSDDKQYCQDLYKHYKTHFANKIKCDAFRNKHNVVDMVQIAHSEKA